MIRPRHHYVYLMRSDRHYYIGIRTCPCVPEKDGYQGSGKALQNAQAAGVQFTKTILCVCASREEAFEIEAALVTEALVADRSCLNLRTGGSGYRVSVETRRRMARAASRRCAGGEWRTPEHKEALRRANLGNKKRTGTRGSERQRLAVAESNRRRSKR